MTVGVTVSYVLVYILVRCKLVTSWSLVLTVRTLYLLTIRLLALSL